MQKGSSALVSGYSRWRVIGKIFKISITQVGIDARFLV